MDGSLPEVIGIFVSQEIGSSLVSFQMIFEALQSELFRFNFHSLSSKILKIPEFALRIHAVILNSKKGIPTKTIRSVRSYAFTKTRCDERHQQIIKGYRREERTVLTSNGKTVTKMSPINDICDEINGLDSNDIDASTKIKIDDHKQDWTKVKNHAWTLLVTISIKCFIEGIAFVLTLQDSFTAGLAFLVAMIVKLFPLEPGYAIILRQASQFEDSFLFLISEIEKP